MNFNVGDRVKVFFHNKWNEGKLVGIEDHPRLEVENQSYGPFRLYIIEVGKIRISTLAALGKKLLS